MKRSSKTNWPQSLVVKLFLSSLLTAGVPVAAAPKSAAKSKTPVPIECPKAILGDRSATEFECRPAGKSTWDGVDATTVSVTESANPKKKSVVYLVKEDTARPIQLDARVALDSAAKVFAKAYPMNVDRGAVRRILKSEFKTVESDVCLSFVGPQSVLVGEVQICNDTPKSVKTPVAVALVPAAVSLAKAKQLTLKEFARLEKEEEVPSVEEIFGDPDTVSRMIVGQDLSSTLYYFWISLFSKNGIALIAVSLDGHVKSESIEGTHEYSAGFAESRMRKWK